MHAVQERVLVTHVHECPIRESIRGRGIGEGQLGPQSEVAQRRVLVANVDAGTSGSGRFFSLFPLSNIDFLPFSRQVPCILCCIVDTFRYSAKWSSLPGTDLIKSFCDHIQPSTFPVPPPRLITHANKAFSTRREEWDNAIRSTPPWASIQRPGSICHPPAFMVGAMRTRRPRNRRITSCCLQLTPSDTVSSRNTRTFFVQTLMTRPQASAARSPCRDVTPCSMYSYTAPSILHLAVVTLAITSP